MSTLFARTGDAHAVKVCAAARLAGVDIVFSPVTTLEELRAKGSNPFGTSKLVLTSPGGAVLTEPNACCTFLGEHTFKQCARSRMTAVGCTWTLHTGNEASGCRRAWCTHEQTQPGCSRLQLHRGTPVTCRKGHTM